MIFEALSGFTWTSAFVSTWVGVCLGDEWTGCETDWARVCVLVFWKWTFVQLEFGKMGFMFGW